MIYIICHDDASEQKAKNMNQGVPLRLSGTSPYFESEAFELLAQREHEWCNEQWVGIITYSYQNKIGYMDFDAICARNIEADVISLFNPNFCKPRVQRSVPFFESVALQMGASCWTAIYIMLKLLSYTDEEIMDPNIQGFFCNYWIAKPKWMSRYISFFKKCKKIAETHPTVKQCLKADAYYTLKSASEETLIKMFGRPVYEMTPFIFERLPCFFFYLAKAKLVRDGLIFNYTLLD